MYIYLIHITLILNCGAVSGCSTLRNMYAESQRWFGNFGHNVPMVRCQYMPAMIHY